MLYQEKKDRKSARKDEGFESQILSSKSKKSKKKPVNDVKEHNKEGWKAVIPQRSSTVSTAAEARKRSEKIVIESDSATEGGFVPNSSDGDSDDGREWTIHY